MPSACVALAFWEGEPSSISRKSDWLTPMRLAASDSNETLESGVVPAALYVPAAVTSPSALVLSPPLTISLGPGVTPSSVYEETSTAPSIQSTLVS